jgi:predicted nuclease of predicted toxin-antitoxin system
MRFCADENFLAAAVEALRQTGHDVFWICTSMGGASDEEVLSLAVAENRILLTFDKDFGDLVFQSSLPATPGIILFRIPTTSPAAAADFISNVISSRDDWSGQFAVVTNEKIRVRKLPD